MLPFVPVILVAAPYPPPAVAWVRAEADNAGAGFVIDAARRRLVTCRHVVGDRDRVDVFFPWVRGGEPVTGKADYLADRGRLRERGLLVTGAVLRRSDATDLALVELPTLPPTATALPLAAADPRPGDRLWAVGHRADLDTLWNRTDGYARQSGRLTDGYFWRGRKLAVNAGALLAQLPIDEGDSGGPVLNERGEAVGLVCALRRQAPLAAVVVSADEIRRFAELPAPPAPPPAAGSRADALVRATAWVRPTATDRHCAAAVVSPELLVTSHRGVGPGDRVGVAFPLRDGDRWRANREAYRDPVGLYLAGAWRAGTVVARDPDRDLALVRVPNLPADARPLPPAADAPSIGEAVHAVGHPSGVEFAWAYAAGSVRQRGRLTLGADPVTVDLLQLPAQASSPGGPVANDRGELVGVLAARDANQQVGYAASLAELTAFLDAARPDRPPQTLAGLAARFARLPPTLAAAAARAYADRDADTALSLDPGCPPARLARARSLAAAGQTDDAIAELDRAAEQGPFDRDVLVFRAELWMKKREPRKARADLERALDPHPEDADARRRLAGVLFELGEDEKAATAAADALRVDPRQLPGLARDWLAQADELAKRNPDAPGRAADWLSRVLTAVRGTLPRHRPAIDEALAGGGSDAERLARLRAAVGRLAGPIRP